MTNFALKETRTLVVVVGWRGRGSEGAGRVKAVYEKGQKIKT